MATGWNGAQLRVAGENRVDTTICAALITTALRPLWLVFYSLTLDTLRRATCPFLRLVALLIAAGLLRLLFWVFSCHLAIIVR